MIHDTRCIVIASMIGGLLEVPQIFGGAVLRQIFTDDQLGKLSQQIDPKRSSPHDYYPLPRFSMIFYHRSKTVVVFIRLHPRPANDAEYLHGILESIAFD
ncbi:hypothetical protein IFM89_016745 [Coptis chinensis]|uniref:Uncharacterized protein n=1 Tax=Coptis chinensis TaxID=261450 RepID=A0A835H6U9_9MAGN|nr:hypothetical protein IFM89_016745 [Coptis chinensis]